MPASEDVMRCYWGFPRSDESDARRAVFAALELVKSRLTSPWINCAIDTACVISEGPGRDQENPQLIESELRVAKCLLPVEGQGSVVVNQAITTLLSADFDLIADETINSSGQFRVVDIRKDLSHIETLPTPTMIGRIAERETLDQTWSEVVGGQPQCIVLTGEAGIGKSTLLRLLKSRCAATRGFWVEVRCRPETRDRPMHAVQRCWRQLGIPASEFDPIKTLDWIRREAKVRPIALAFEDVQWADPATLEFIAAIGQYLHGLGRVCLIRTSRLKQLPELNTSVPNIHLVLRRHDTSEIDRIVDQQFRSAELSSGMREKIAIRSEGVPLFAEELVRLHTSVDGADTLDVLLEPGRLNAVLGARLDTVGELRPLAQAAAVIGRDFETSTLATMLRMDHAQLAAGIANLVEEGVIEHLPGRWRGNTYRFSHGLLRDAAYASILMSHRRNLHRAVAEILSQDAAREVDHSPEIVAAHFAAAADCKGAFIWWSKAGRRAAQLSATGAAVVYFKQALAARTQDPDAGSLAEEVEILKALGVQLVSLHGNAAEAVLDIFQRCFDLAQQLPGLAEKIDASWMLQSCHLVRGDVMKAMDIGKSLVAIADHHGTDEQRMRAHRIQGLAKLLSGRLHAAFEHYRIVLGLYDERRHAGLRFQHASDQGALAYAHLAWGEAIAHRQDASVRHAKLALELASRLQHPHTSAHVMCVLAARAQTLGDRQKASALAYAAKSLSERHEFPYWQAWANIILGWSTADRTDGGLAEIDQAIKSYLKTGARQAAPYAMMLYGEAALALGLPKKALAALQDGWQLAERNGVFLYAPELLRLCAIAEWHLGRSSQHVAAILEKARTLAEGQGARLFYERVSIALKADVHKDCANIAVAL
ncbi:ATP-binding protein [Leptospira interrogans]